MLAELSVRNFALLQELRLNLGPGLNVLTGETGAGKSIIIDALSLLLGGRASTEVIRTGCDTARIEAVFALKPGLVDTFLQAHDLPANPDGTLVMTRELHISGRSKCRLNDHLVTVGTLAELGQLLVDIHGQHEHQSLVRPETHLTWLDGFAGQELLALRARYQQTYKRWQECTKLLAQIRAEERERARRLERLRFEVEEITRAQLRSEEEQTLEEEHQRLSQAEALGELVAQSLYCLTGSEGAEAAPNSRDLLAQAAAALSQAQRLDPTLEPLLTQLNTLLLQLDEVGWQLRDYQDKLTAEPARLAELEARLALIEKLKYKYGASIAEVLAYRDSAAAELETLAGAEDEAGQLEAELAVLTPQLSQLAAELTAARQAAAVALATQVEAQLASLKMGQTRFEVAVETTSNLTAFTPTGADQVEFMLAPNPGEALKPLAKIASGGEISRIMLALKCILVEVDQTPTLIFDEIDTGIGGRTLQAVAERLATLGATHQVLCVTHAPQIAAMAQHHFAIHKQTTAGRTHTEIECLGAEARVEELARMLGGAEVTERTRAHAREMLALAGGSSR